MSKLHLCLAAATLLAACPMPAAESDGGVAGGGPVAGPIDNHCYVWPDGGPGGPLRPQPVDPAACNPDAGADADAGSPLGTGFGPTNYDAEANDDDCKYQVGFTATPLVHGVDQTFTVSAVHTTDGTPVTGANALIEAFLSDTHPGDTARSNATEVSPGVYSIGPIRFDVPGQWTVRFHFNEQCVDLLPTSPHGHAAFYVNVQ
ncbi:MAG: FixH family protein [Deltaproteobacteria bacterium]